MIIQIYKDFTTKKKKKKVVSLARLKYKINDVIIKVSIVVVPIYVG